LQKITIIQNAKQMNKLIIFIFCCCPFILVAQTNDANLSTNAHKSGFASASRVNNVIFSMHLFSHKLFADSRKIKEFEKNSIISGNRKLNNKNFLKFSSGKNRLSVRAGAGFSKQINEINKRMKNIFHSDKSSGAFSNLAGLSLIVGELPTVVDDGSIFTPSDPKINKFINSYPQNSLMSYVLGSIFTPSGFYIGLAVPVPYTKTVAIPKKGD